MLSSRLPYLIWTVTTVVYGSLGDRGSHYGGVEAGIAPRKLPAPAACSFCARAHEPPPHHIQLHARTEAAPEKTSTPSFSPSHLLSPPQFLRTHTTLGTSPAALSPHHRHPRVHCHQSYSSIVLALHRLRFRFNPSRQTHPQPLHSHCTPPRRSLRSTSIHSAHTKNFLLLVLLL